MSKKTPVGICVNCGHKFDELKLVLTAGFSFENGVKHEPERCPVCHRMVISYHYDIDKGCYDVIVKKVRQ